MGNRVSLIDRINKLEKKLNNTTDVDKRKYILQKIMHLEYILEKLEDRTIN